MHLKNRNHQAMYGVIHGGIDFNLRKKSCRVLTSLPFDGFAIGGSMGKDKQEMFSMLDFTLCHLPKELPTHLLGIADLSSLDLCIPLGIDTFDSSYPTKAARHGSLLTKKGPLKISRTVFAKRFEPIEQGCSCYSCTHFSLAYLHHLFKARELSALTIASIHNLHFMVELMGKYRQKIYLSEI